MFINTFEDLYTNVYFEYKYIYIYILLKVEFSIIERDVWGKQS